MTLHPLWWQRWAACRGLTTNQWFPDKGDHATKELAQKVCAACPVKNPCLLYALRTDQQEGIWGGLTPNQRTRILGVPAAARRRKRPFQPRPTRLQPCGTNAAYLRHLRNRETPCHACHDAHLTYQRDYHARRSGTS